MTGILIRKGEHHMETQTQREEGQVVTEAEPRFEGLKTGDQS